MVRLRNVDMKLAAGLLGYADGKADPVILSLMQECEAPLMEASHPVFSYGVFDCELCGTEYVVLRECRAVMSGTDIVQALAGCEKAACMAVTLGKEVDELLRQLQGSSMPKAMITEAMAGALLTQLCDDIQVELMGHFPDYRQTPRIRPGYGDFPLAFQKELLRVVEAESRMQLHMLENGRLQPAQSATAVVGLTNLTKITGAVHMDLSEGACGTEEACSHCSHRGSCETLQNKQNESGNDKAAE